MQGTDVGPRTSEAHETTGMQGVQNLLVLLGSDTCTYTLRLLQAHHSTAELSIADANMNETGGGECIYLCEFSGFTTKPVV